MNLSRRGFLAGLIAAPAIVKIDSIMPVKGLISDIPRVYGQEYFVPTVGSSDSYFLFLNEAEHQNLASIASRIGGTIICEQLQLPSTLMKGKLFK